MANNIIDLPVLSSKPTKSLPSQQERPWLRQAAWLYAHGHSREEIADACGVQKEAISIVLRQASFADLVKSFVAETGTKIGIQKQISRAAVDAFMVMSSLLNSTVDSMRFNAAKFILEQAYGKAPQIIRHESPISEGMDPLEEAKMLDAKLVETAASLQKEGLLQLKQPSKVA